MVRASVILSTFDQPNALTFSLLGYRRQSVGDFEIVVADDGSDDETRRVVERFGVKHVWQPNRGYRRAKIANEAAKVSAGRVLILTDGDCIPHADFVKVHLERCGSQTFCAGGYVRLTPAHSRSLTEEAVRAGEYEGQLTSGDRWRFRVTHWKNRIGVLVGNPRKPKVYGCNLSVDRETYWALNGYDENFDGFGKEDSDLRNRLRRFGATPVSVWGRAWVYHVDDAIDPKVRERRIPRRKHPEYYYRRDVPVRCENGLVK